MLRLQAALYPSQLHFILPEHPSTVRPDNSKHSMQQPVRVEMVGSHQPHPCAALHGAALSDLIPPTTEEHDQIDQTRAVAIASSVSQRK